MRQGDTSSFTTYYTIAEHVQEDYWESLEINIYGEKINHLRFADNIVLILEDVKESQNILHALNRE